MTDALYIILYAGAMLFAITLGYIRNNYYVREEIDIITHFGSPLSSLEDFSDLDSQI